MDRLSVRGDNPRAYLHIHVDNYGITFYNTYISVDLAYHKICRAKVGNGVKNRSII